LEGTGIAEHPEPLVCLRNWAVSDGWPSRPIVQMSTIREARAMMPSLSPDQLSELLRGDHDPGGHGWCSLYPPESAGGSDHVHDRVEDTLLPWASDQVSYKQSQCRFTSGVAPSSFTPTCSMTRTDRWLSSSRAKPCCIGPEPEPLGHLAALQKSLKVSTECADTRSVRTVEQGRVPLLRPARRSFLPGIGASHHPSPTSAPAVSAAPGQS
jgi:hypothetical protein